MQRYEYKVVPAPQRAEKAKGAKTTAERFATALMVVMNDLGRDGWDYVRADTLPCEERVGLTGKSSSFQHMLVFRRPLPERVETVAEPSASRNPVVSLTPESTSPRVTPFAKPVIVAVSPAIANGTAPGAD